MGEQLADLQAHFWDRGPELRGHSWLGTAPARPTSIVAAYRLRLVERTGVAMPQSAIARAMDISELHTRAVQWPHSLQQALEQFVATSADRIETLARRLGMA